MFPGGLPAATGEIVVRAPRASRLRLEAGALFTVDLKSKRDSASANSARLGFRSVDELALWRQPDGPRPAQWNEIPLYVRHAR